MEQLTNYKIIKIIKRRRLLLGMSQSTLAEKCGITRQAISKMESTNSNPTALNLLKICETLGLNVHDFYE